MATARNLLGNRWDLTGHELAGHEHAGVEHAGFEHAGFESEERAPVSSSTPMNPGPVAIRPSTLTGVQRAELLVRQAQALLDAAAEHGATYDLRLAQGLTESLLDRLEAISRKR